jgi:hypothetical protein
MGLVWDGNRFWASDYDDGKIYRGNAAGDDWEEWLDWPGSPGPLAWQENAGLWVVDEASGKLVRLVPDPESVTLIKDTTIAIPPVALREVPSITGLTWDGDALWLATGCGLCSGFYQINPSTGQVLQSFFPSCEPRGLAFSSGRWPIRGELWTVAYSGPKKDALLSKRKVASDPGSVSSPQSFSAFGSGAFISPPRDPIAIAIRNGEIWVVDGEFDQISQYDPRPLVP